MIPKIGHFEKPLQELNLLLSDGSLTLKIVVVGAFAMHLLNLSGQFTADVDSVVEIQDEKIRSLISTVGAKYNLAEDWINDSASTIDLPDGFYNRLSKLSLFSNIDIFVANRIDLICLKSRAYLHRGEYDKKDLEDLIRLKPSSQEIEVAVDFIRKTSTPPEPDLFPDFEDIIKEIYSVVT